MTATKKSNGHTFKYEGACAGCRQDFAGCRFCRVGAYGKKGCSCPVEAIHVARAMRWRRRDAAAAATAAQPAPVGAHARPMSRPDRLQLEPALP